MNQRIIPWGTVIAGAIALGTASLIGLTEIAGVSLPLSSAGPGAVIVVGILILVTGLIVVLRSSRAGRGSDRPTPATAPPSAAATRSTPTAAPSAAGGAGASPLDVATPVDATQAVLTTSATPGPDVDARQSSH